MVLLETKYPVIQHGRDARDDYGSTGIGIISSTVN